MNKAILIGRLTKDAEIRQFGEDQRSVLKFSIAVNRDYLTGKNDGEADFFPVAYWTKSAEALGKYLTKGKLICVTGRINIRSYNSEDGAKKYFTEIIADEIQFLEGNRSKEVI